jgi:hypothetical protein
MFCPLCKSEYRDGFTRCSDCDADLVSNLQSSSDESSELFAKLVWSGADHFKFAGVKAVLEEAKIPFTVATSRSSVLFPSMQPAYEVRVAANNEDRALSLIGEPETTGDEDSEDPSQDEFPLEEGEDALKTSESDAPDESHHLNPTPDNWDPEMATCEAWKGNDLDMSNGIQASLIENGIGFQVISDPGPIRIMIYPENEGQAREIMREIKEAQILPDDNIHPA